MDEKKAIKLYWKQLDCIEKKKCAKETAQLKKANQRAETELAPLRKQLVSSSTSKLNKIKITKRMQNISDVYEAKATKNQYQCLLNRCQKEVKDYLRYSEPYFKKGCAKNQSHLEKQHSCLTAELSDKANRRGFVDIKEYSDYKEKVKIAMRKHLLKLIK